MKMNTHSHFEESLPLYAAGKLQGAQRLKIEKHLSTCLECQADLELWKAVSAEINFSDQMLEAPPALADQSLEKIHTRSALSLALLRSWQLLRPQALLVQSEMWPASAAVMALGVIVALLSNHAEAVYFIAPLVAAASMTVLFGPVNDPAYELTLATPTSPWKVLLARLSIVSGYNMLLSLAAAFALLIIVPPGLLGTLILGWLGLMAFLSALALLLSLWIGTGNAVIITYALWIVQYVPYRLISLWMVSTAWEPFINAYQQFWHSPLLLILLSLFLIGMALWSANRPVFRLTQLAR
jgi:hypothetical protein